MPTMKVNNVDIAYQLHGDDSHPTVVLIQGLATPLTGWPIAMVNEFVRQGFQVLLLDNRDIGKSELLNQLSIPNVASVLLKLKFGLTPKVPYQLSDMAADVAALIDALDLKKVHVVGTSMGGMIAQLLTINHPDKVHTLTSIMSNTSNKNLPKASPEVNKQLMSKPESSSFSDRVKLQMATLKLIGSPKYPAKQQDLERTATEILERGVTAKGVIRQMLAIMVSKNREKLLAKISTPTLVIHGDSDPLVHLEGGKATARAISCAKIKIFEGMGHDFPVQLQSAIVNEIVTHLNTWNNNDLKQ